MDNKTSKSIPNDTQLTDRSSVDEDLGVMIYSHIKIIDTDTNEILVNKRA